LKVQSRDPLRFRIVPVLTLAVFLGVACIIIARFSYGAEKTDLLNGNREKATLHIITAENLILDSEADFAEFSGNARAVLKENIVITANKLKIFFKDGSNINRELAAGEESIKKIVADDNVRITFDNRIAVAEKATYQTDEKILVLSGKDSKIIMGKDSITGTKITFYRADGRIKVEGNGKEQVKAIFHTNTASDPGGGQSDR